MAQYLNIKAEKLSLERQAQLNTLDYMVKTTRSSNRQAYIHIYIYIYIHKEKTLQK